MASITTTSYLSVPTSTDKLERLDARRTHSADEALGRLLKNESLQESLSQQSNRWIPVRESKVIGTLWGMFQKGRSAFINKENVRRAVQEVGGSTVAADALWAKLSPNKASIVSAGEFALNDYLSDAVSANLKDIRENVEKARVQQAAKSLKSNSILDYFA